MKFYPYENGGGGGRKKLSLAEGWGEGGGTTSFSCIGRLEVGGGGRAKRFHSLKGEGAQKVLGLPCLEGGGGGGCKRFRTRDFPIF